MANELENKNTEPGWGEVSLLSVLSAFVYTPWGAYINWDYGSAVVIRVVTAQALLSIAVTLVYTRLMIVLYRRGKSRLAHATWAFLGAGILVNTGIASSYFLIGAPRILATMAPGMIAGTVYAAVYVARLDGLLRMPRR